MTLTRTAPCILYLDVFPEQYIQGMKAAGIRRYAAALGWETKVVSHEASRPKDIPALLRRRRPAGCIVQSHFGRMDLPPHLFGATRVVYLDPDPALCSGRVAYVSPDDDAIVDLAMRELAANRPSAYAYVGGYYPAPWDAARATAFREQAGATGLPQSEFRCAPGDATYVLPDARESDRAAAHAARLARLSAWLATLPRRTAIMAVNDGSAADVFVAARAAGLSIPHDLSLVGVDNSIPRHPSFVGVDNQDRLSGTADTPISTVMVDYEHAGFVAAKLLADGGQRATFGPMLVIRRKSTRGRGRRAPFILEAVEIIRRWPSSISAPTASGARATPSAPAGSPKSSAPATSRATSISGANTSSAPRSSSPTTWTATRTSPATTPSSTTPARRAWAGATTRSSWSRRRASGTTPTRQSAIGGHCRSSWSTSTTPPRRRTGTGRRNCCWNPSS